MGWGQDFLRILDLGDPKIEENRKDIDFLKRHSRAQHEWNPFGTTPTYTQRLQQENDELKLYVAAIFRLLVSKGIATQNEIRNLVERIDAEEGAVDGRFEGDVVGPGADS